MALRDLEKARLKQLTPEQQKWVAANVVLGLEDLRSLSRDAIIHAFPPKKRAKKKKPAVGADGKPKKKRHYSNSPVNDSGVIYTLIWQFSLLIAAGLERAMRGNLRSFWYRVVEKFYTHQDLLNLPVGPDMDGLVNLVLDANLPPSQVRLLANTGGEGGAHGTYLLRLISQGMDDFVVAGIFTFEDPWDFRDIHASSHRVGTPPSIIFFTEKEGLLWFADEVFNDCHVSVMASNGEPGYITVEFFAKQLQGHKDRVLWVCALCDYDPWGLEIAENLKRKLELPVFRSGDPFEVRLTYITSLAMFPPEEIAHKRDLRVDDGKGGKKVPKRVQRWIDETAKQSPDHLGGVYGEAFSLHVDNADFDNKVKPAVVKWVAKVKEEQKQHRRRLGRAAVAAKQVSQQVPKASRAPASRSGKAVRPRSPKPRLKP